MGSIRGTLTSSISLNSLENALFCVNSFRQVAQTGSFINSETSNFKIPIPIFISICIGLSTKFQRMLPKLSWKRASILPRAFLALGKAFPKLKSQPHISSLALSINASVLGGITVSFAVSYV